MSAIPDVSRRRFIQGASVVGAMAAVGVPGLAACQTDANAPASATGEETTARCVCRPNCGGFCAHEVTIRDGNVVKSTFAPYEETPEYNRICLRGISNVQRMYNADRIKYPMRRVGERGADKWERISWDDAIAEITDKWKEAADKYGSQANSFYAGTGGHTLLQGSLPGSMALLMNAMESTKIDVSLDVAFSYGLTRLTGGMASGWNELTDFVNSNVIIIAGYNVTEANIHNWHFFQDAMEAGAKVIVVDPVYTHAAAQATEYIPCRPASDPIWLLAMCNVIIEEDLHDKDFLINKTVAPFLVREDTGMFLRMSDLGVAPTEGPVNPATGEPTQVDPPAVWDKATNSAVAYDQATDMSLEETREVDGFAVNTAFTLLKERVSEYTVEEAAEMSLIPADKIVELARAYANGPSSLITGWGSQAFNNGHQVGHAFGVIAALTGNMGKPGASFGNSWQLFAEGINWLATMPDGRIATTVPNVVLPEIVSSGKFKGEDFPIKNYYCFQGNPLSGTVDQVAYKNEVFDKMDFIVTADLAFTDTARYSDIVLPVAHYYEMEDVISASGGLPYVQFSEKAIDPLFEAKAETDIARLLAAGMGMEDIYGGMTDAELIDLFLDTPASHALGINYKNLKEKGYLRYKPEPWIHYEGQTFPTETGRMEIYLENAVARADYGQEIDQARERLPQFFPPTETWPGTEAFKKYPLTLLSERPRFRVHTMWFDSPWLRELDPDQTLKIHPKDAADRGIEQGDMVEIYNDRGSTVARAVLTEGIMPGVLTYPKGWQRHQVEKGSFSELNSNVIDPAGVNMSFFDAQADVRKWEGK